MFHQKIFPFIDKKPKRCLIRTEITHPPLYSKTRFRIDEGLPVGMPGVVYRLGMDGPTLEVGDVQVDNFPMESVNMCPATPKLLEAMWWRLVKCHFFWVKGQKLLHLWPMVPPENKTGWTIEG